MNLATAEAVSDFQPKKRQPTTSARLKQFNLSTAQQIETGVKKSFLQNQGQWSLALYEIVKEDLLTKDPGAPAQQIQVGQQSSRGLEASLALALNRSLTLNTNVAILEAEFDDFDESVGGILVSREANVCLDRDIAYAWRASTGVRSSARGILTMPTSVKCQTITL